MVGPVKDTQCGFKGFTRVAAQDLFARQQILSIVFDVELIFLARKRGYELGIVPIRWADKRGSRMRARPGLALRVAWDLFRIPIVHRRVGAPRGIPQAGGAAGLPVMASRGSGRTLAHAALPVVAIGTVIAAAGAVALAAGNLLGYDFQAYVQAADRLLAGEPLYDPSVSVAGGFAIYLYPPPFAIADDPVRALPEAVAVGLWTVLLGACVIAAALLMPVRREIRWIVILLAAFDWPVLYSIKLGQVGPILLLLFAIGWRWMDRPGVLAASIVGGAVTKLQPAALVGGRCSPAASGRPRTPGRRSPCSALAVGGPARADDGRRLRRAARAGQLAGDDAAQLHARRDRLPGGRRPRAWRPRSSSRPWSSRSPRRSSPSACADDEASYLVVVVATQLVSPLLWDHYAILLLLPVAWLLERRQWWAVALPIATSIPLLWLVPSAIYPIEFVDLPASRRSSSAAAERRCRRPRAACRWPSREGRDELVPDRPGLARADRDHRGGRVLAVPDADRWRTRRRPRTTGRPIRRTSIRTRRRASRTASTTRRSFDWMVAWGRVLPFEVFVAIWRAILLVALVYLAGPFTIFVLFTVPVASEINAGNIQILLALAIVLGFRWPATWAFVLLTKVTPGIGAAVVRAPSPVAGAGDRVRGHRRDRRSCRSSCRPGAWFDYLELWIGSAPAPAVAPYYLSFWQRLPFALAFIVFGAWQGYRWPVVVGSTLALPVYYIISSSMLVGVLPYLREALGRIWLERAPPRPLAPAPIERPKPTPAPG